VHVTGATVEAAFPRILKDVSPASAPGRVQTTSTDPGPLAQRHNQIRRTRP